MRRDRVVVVGASAGGVRALEELVSGLAADLAAAVLIVLHVSPRHRSVLPEILSAAGPVPAQHAVTGEKLENGRIYVAPPDHHLLIGDGRLLLTGGPKENHHRPSIDLLFRSAAYHFGNRAVGVVLSGLLSDGSSGLFSIKRLGGIGIIQDPQEAAYSSMPLAAARRVDVDHALTAREIGPLLSELVRQPIPDEPVGAASYRLALKEDIDRAMGKPPSEFDMMHKREPSPYTCPDCFGVLFRIPEGTQDRFRCHTGHGYTLPALFGEYFESMEGKLWQTVKAMQETLFLVAEAAERAAAANEAEHAAALNKTKDELQKRLEIMRALAVAPPRSDAGSAS
jgi:two-component system, chemotaxis family, protein-glutamate methylesterase/glutaminase